MKLELTVTQEQFTNKDSEVITYFVYSAEIEGETVKFQPKDADKKLVEHFVKRALKVGAKS